MAPQSGVGGCAPNPRKLNAVVDRIAAGRERETRTRTVGIMLGSRYLIIIVKSDSPMALAANMNSLLTKDCTFALVILVKDGQLSKAIATMT